MIKLNCFLQKGQLNCRNFNFSRRLKKKDFRRKTEITEPTIRPPSRRCYKFTRMKFIGHLDESDLTNYSKCNETLTIPKRL